jgi:hypothetical protein
MGMFTPICFLGMFWNYWVPKRMHLNATPEVFGQKCGQPARKLGD